MKILKKGNKQLAELRQLQPILFDCSYCGCSWIANKGEYKCYSNQLDNDDSYYYDCPCCGSTVYSIERVTNYNVLQ